jgi:flagellar hook assembly protein FlgD
MIWLADVDAGGDQYYFDNFVLGIPAAGSPAVASTAITHEAVPTTNSISDVYPNPFNPSTNIRYTLTEPAVVTMRVYSVLGQEVATLVDGAQGAGIHTVVWDGRNSNGKPMGSGVYICRMMGSGANGQPITSVKRLLLVK